jgi:hypothetical protein
VEFVPNVSETVSVSIIRGLYHECCGGKFYPLEREFVGGGSYCYVLQWDYRRGLDWRMDLLTTYTQNS